MRELLQKDFNMFVNNYVNTKEFNSFLYNRCYENSTNIDFLYNHFQKSGPYAYGELAFRYFWLIILNELKSNGKILEIGVYKGSTLSLFRLISNYLNSQFDIFGLTPLNETGDKYSTYHTSNYSEDIKNLHSLFHLSHESYTIFNGLSTNEELKESIRNQHKFDLVYVDGGHDYDTVINDIEFTDQILEVNGFLITDDSSSGLDFPPDFIGFRGHSDVNLALNDNQTLKEKYIHLFACGHNRCWKKIK